MSKKINALEHRRVPDHKVLDGNEAEKILKKKGMERENLPFIKKSDPALENLEVEVGDIVEISRESPTAGEYKYFRRIIED